MVKYNKREDGDENRLVSIEDIIQICQRWGGDDDWGVHSIYVSTLVEKLREKSETKFNVSQEFYNAGYAAGRRALADEIHNIIENSEPRTT